MNMPLDALPSGLCEQLQAWPGDKLKVLKLSLYGEPLRESGFRARCCGWRERRTSPNEWRATTNASLLTRELAEALVRVPVGLSEGLHLLRRPRAAPAHHPVHRRHRRHP